MEVKMVQSVREHRSSVVGGGIVGEHCGGGGVIDK